MPGIVVIGNISIRLVIEVPHLPVPGESVQGGPLRSYAGGKGANQATAAARAGAQVALLGRVGIDEFGRANLTALQDQGVDVSAVVSDQPVGTGVAMVAVDTDGELLLFTSPGANQTLSPAHVRSADFARPILFLGWSKFRPRRLSRPSRSPTMRAPQPSSMPNPPTTCPRSCWITPTI